MKESLENKRENLLSRISGRTEALLGAYGACCGMEDIYEFRLKLILILLFTEKGIFYVEVKVEQFR